jgi:hypothetical protein
MAFEKEKEIMRGSGLEVSLSDHYGGDSLRGVYLDIALSLMSRMAICQLLALRVDHSAYLWILLEIVQLENGFWKR